MTLANEDPVELRVVSELLVSEVKALSLKVEQLQHQLHGANRHRFGSKSEGLDQLKQPASPQESIGPKPKRKHSRKPLPDHLDREDEELSPVNKCGKCGGSLRTLGEDVTEELEYGETEKKTIQWIVFLSNGRFKVKRIIRPRKACSCCEAIVQTPLPSPPIERGRPGPGLLAPFGRFASAKSPAGQ